MKRESKDVDQFTIADTNGAIVIRLKRMKILLNINLYLSDGISQLRRKLLNLKDK